ncbi:hypothetical protein [Streptomyces sp. NPDC006784]|uniref:hypothetical protein n=1 Tax=Streptomyces sp. NPDC006784 TaxID=3364764 RepID=UPI0036993DE8
MTGNDTAGPFVPPLEMALDGARRALDEAAGIDWCTVSLPVLAAHLGSLNVSLQMLADAVDNEVYGPPAAVGNQAGGL